MNHPSADPRPLKDRIAEYVCAPDHVTFAELGNRFGADFQAEAPDPGFALEKGPNLVLWMGVTEEGADAFINLVDEGVIVLHPTVLLTYLADGRSLTLPICKGRRPLKKPHWLPVTLRPGPNAVRSKRSAA